MQALGKYEIIATIGKGAMGVVLKGFDPIIDRHVALKTVNKENLDDSERDELIARFRKEAQAAGRLAHPNIVQIYDYGETQFTAYIVMEYVEGRGLRDYLANQGSFSLAEVGRLMEQLLRALAYAHEHGVVHRDIKPANLLVDATRQLKVTDFGIARISSSQLTQTGSVMGTPSYMAPEQFAGSAGVDGRADVFSAGVVLYEMLTGRKPFQGSTESVAYQILHENHRPPSELNPALGTPFDGIIARALAKRPEGRYPDAAAFAAELAQAIADQEARNAEPTILSTMTMFNAGKGERSTLNTDASQTTDWSRTDLRPLVEMLTKVMGPVARVLVKKVAAETTDPTLFAARLAEHLDLDVDRTRFLKVAEALFPKPGSMTSTRGTQPLASQSHGPDVALLERATAALAAHVGPIAKVLVKRAAAQSQGAKQFLEQIAQHIGDEAQRAKFLKQFKP